LLSGPEQLEWVDAFFKAFSAQEFRDLLGYRLDDSIESWASDNDPKNTAMGKVIAAYSRRSEEDRLIAAAIEARPRAAALLRIASRQKVAAAPDDPRVERLIRDTSSFLDIGKWLDLAGKLQVCVCRIEIVTQSGKMTFGTGFLIADDWLLTNYHVMEPVIATEDHDADYAGPRASAADVLCRFDYKVLASGVTSAGSAIKLAHEWRVTVSPNTEGELDFAVVRLAQPVGSQPVGNNPNAPGDPRGWIPLPIRFAPDFAPHGPLFIIQHPKAEPLKLALDTDAIEGVSADRTRLRYTTNTEPGSSGSPCFDQDWRLIALHHAGDPDFTPTYNEGIPIDAIVNRLTQNGVLAG
jgi:Trypsin-like peptidase domain